MNWLAWALLAALFAGITAVLAKVGVTDLNSHLATAIRTSVVLVFTWIIAFAAVGSRDWSAITSRQWLFLSLSGMTTGLSWLCYFRALQLGEVSKVAPVDKLSVAIAIALSFVFLGERLAPREIAGVAMIIGGAVVLAWK